MHSLDYICNLESQYSLDCGGSTIASMWARS